MGRWGSNCLTDKDKNMRSGRADPGCIPCLFALLLVSERDARSQNDTISLDRSTKTKQKAGKQTSEDVVRCFFWCVLYRMSWLTAHSAAPQPARYGNAVFM